MISLLIAVTLAGPVQAAKDVPRLWKTWINKDALSAAFNFTIEDVASDVLVGTPYAGRLRINEPPRANHLNFYMVRRQFAGDARNNCVIEAKYEAIICDADFVNAFIHAIQIDAQGLPEANTLAAVTGFYQQFLTFWLLTHEIGHIVLGHSVDKIEPGAWGNLAETDADTFVLTNMAQNHALQFSSFMTLSQMATSLYLAELEHEYPAEVIEQAYDALRAEGREISFSVPLPVHLKWDSRRHPPWLIRVLDMADLLFLHYPTMIDTSGYWKRLKANVLPNPKDQQQQGSDAGWKEGNALLDNLLVEPLEDFAFEADAEQLVRLVLQGDDLVPVAIDNFAVRAATQRDPAYLEAFLICLRATSAWEKGDNTAAASLLAEAVLPRHPDLFLAELFYLTQIRLESDVARRATMAEQFPDSIVLAAQPNADSSVPSDREQLRATVAIWEIYARGLGFEDTRTADYTDHVLQQLYNTPYDMLKSDFLTRWRRLVADLPSGGPQSLTKANQLLAIGDVAQKLGRPVEAVAAIGAALSLIETMPSREPQVMAFWNDVAARQLMALGLPDQTIKHATLALRYRRDALEMEMAYDPAISAHGRMQVAIALNQLGFAYITDQQFEPARVALEEALALREAENDDAEELATVRHNLAQTYVALGDPRGRELARLAFEARRDLDVGPMLVANSMLVRSSAEYLAGDLVAARKWAAKSLTLWTAAEDFRQPTGSMVTAIDGQMVNLAVLLGDMSLESEAVDRLPPTYPERLSIILAAEQAQSW